MRIAVVFLLLFLGGIGLLAWSAAHILGTWIYAPIVGLVLCGAAVVLVGIRPLLGILLAGLQSFRD